MYFKKKEKISILKTAIVKLYNVIYSVYTQLYNSTVIFIYTQIT